MTSSQLFSFEPFEVQVTIGGGGMARERAGRYTMRMSPEYLYLNPEKEGGFISNRQPISIDWTALRELRNRLRNKGYFQANFGPSQDQFGNKGELILSIGIADPQQRERIASLLDELPPEVAAQRCPKCQGSVVNDACSKCGTRFSEHYRRHGLGLVASGVILSVVGTVLTAWSFSSASPGDYVYVFWGVIVFGIILCLRGLFQLVFGVRTGNW